MIDIITILSTVVINYTILFLVGAVSVYIHITNHMFYMSYIITGNQSRNIAAVQLMRCCCSKSPGVYAPAS